LEESVSRSRKSCFSFRFDTFREFESSLEEMFSPSAAFVILYTSAGKCGKDACKKVMKRAKTRREALLHLSMLKRWENWGKLAFEGVDFENGTGKIIVVNSFETVNHRSNQPCCHFLRGFLAGFLSELFCRGIRVYEEKCAGKGDEYCEFTFA